VARGTGLARRCPLRVRPLFALVAAVGVLTGCATAPTSGAAQPLPGNNGQAQAFVQPLPPPGPGPATQWTPNDVVLGFLHASASFALDPEAARRYLAPGVSWDPNPSNVLIVSQLSIITVTCTLKVAPSCPQAKTIKLRATPVASIRGSGQYSVESGTIPLRFGLAMVNGGWRISSVPNSHLLLLFESDFRQVFQAKSLYFFANAPLNEQDLVPDPVFVPLQANSNATSTVVADELVRGLLTVPSTSWLAGAVSTAFPRGTALLQPVTVSSNLTVTVNLGGAAARASGKQVGRMYAQLRQTLTMPSYSLPIADSLVLEINGRVRRGTKSRGTGVPDLGGKTPSTLYYATNEQVRQVPAGGGTPSATPPWLTTSSNITALAVSPDGSHVAAAVPDGNGCAIAVNPPLATDVGGSLVTWANRSGPCTSLSWDDSGDLWATSGSQVWVTQQRGVGTQSIPLPTWPHKNPKADYHVLSMQIAPDGVRAAMLVSGPAGNQLLLAAVTYFDGGPSFGPAVPVGADLPSPGPMALTWYTPYYLAVLDGSQIYEVPLTGGQWTLLSLPPTTGATSITSSGDALAIGTTVGRPKVWINTSPASGGNWRVEYPYVPKRELVLGTAGPVYPG
jgi:hypothetical protein